MISSYAMTMLLHSQVGATGAGWPMTTSAAVGKQLTQFSLIRYRLDVPCLSTGTNRTSAKIFRWWARVHDARGPGYQHPR